MIDLKPNPDITRILIAGRRAALAALWDAERSKDIPGSIDSPPESYDGTGEITIISRETPVGLSALIDAAVMETMVQIGNGNAPVTKTRRPWWRFWA